jgi:phosphonate transport system ATP-binding protein
VAAIEVRNLQKTFPNGHTALVDMSFAVPPGQFVCIVGRSGAGKSTLMRCLNGSLPLTAGEARVGEFDIGSLGPSERRALQRSVGFIYQEFNLIGRLTALQNVLTGRLGHMPTWRAVAGYFTHEDRRIALEALERVNMLHKAPQRCDSLSGGEKQRVATARAFAQEPLVLLADEPVANLDPELAEEVFRDLRRVAKELNVTTLVNIHNIVQARRFADRIIGIARGRVVFDGSPQEFDEAAVDRVYRFDKADAGVDLSATLDPSVLRDLVRAVQAGEAHADDLPEAIRRSFEDQAFVHPAAREHGEGQKHRE